MKIPFLIFTLFLSITLFAQEGIVNDGNLPEAEFHTAINPTNTDNMVVATMSGFFNPDEDNINIYYPMDAGISWTQCLAPPSTGNLSGDPVISFDANGNLNMANLTLSPINQEVISIISQSTDGGATWTEKNQITGNVDKPWIATDISSNSPGFGNTYIPIVGNQVTLYSFNENLEKLDSLIVDVGIQLPSIAINREGTVFVSTVGLGGDNEVFVSEISNNGTVKVHSTLVATFPDYTFNVPDISDRFQPAAYIAVDNSEGPFDGRLYLAYTASEPANPTYFDVLLQYSDDNGVTWSDAKKVSTNQEDKIQQFYSSIYVNQDGVLLIDYYDRQNHENTNTLTDFFLSYSEDGGDSFTEVQLNAEPSNFDIVVGISDDFGIGEYHQVLATEDHAYSFWSDGRSNNGDLNIYMAKVALDGSSNVQQYTVLSDKISISDLYPLPSDGTIFTDIDVKASTKIKYRILNASGKEVVIKDWEQLLIGKNRLAINTDFPSGTYFIHFVAESGYFKTMKFVKQ